MPYKKRLLILFAIICFFCFLVIPARLFQLQISQGHLYQARVEKRKTRKGVINAARGKILDRNGLELATQRPAYDLSIRPRSVIDEDRLLTVLSAILEVPKTELDRKMEETKRAIVHKKLLQARTEKNRRRKANYKFLLFKNVVLSTDQAEQVKSKLPIGIYLRNQTSRYWWLFKQSTNQYEIRVDFVKTGFDLQDLKQPLSSILKKAEEEIKDVFNSAKNKLMTKILRRASAHHFYSDVPFKKIVQIEMRRSELLGIQIVPRSVRFYPKGNLLSPMIGSIGRIDEKQLKALLREAKDPLMRRWARSGITPRSNNYYYSGLHRELRPLGLELNDMVGRSGIESVFEEFLRGQRGQRIIERDHRDRRRDTITETSSRAGHDIVLTIDARFQEIVEKEFDRTAGAAVFADVHSGEILAAASFPGFDLNDLVSPVSKATFEYIYNEKTSRAVNRVLTSEYPLGSIFKVLTSICFLEENILSPSSIISCQGSLHPSNPSVFRCWKRSGHGNITLHEAIQQSCNVYYFKTADRAGLAPILKWGKEFEFGVRPGTELKNYDSSGLLPSPEWNRLHSNEPWYKGNTRSLSIGQDKLIVNPIQVVRMMVAIANGGTLLPAKLIYKIQSEDGRSVEFRKQFPHRMARKIPISSKTIRVIHRAMTDVVHTPKGTAYKAFAKHPLPFQVAGKTSTAQTGTPDGNIGWFAGFFPVDKPEIAFAVVVEGLIRSDQPGVEEHGGDVAAPIVHRILEKYDFYKHSPVAKYTVQEHE